MKKIVVLNADKINYDHKLDLSGFGENTVIYGDTPEELIIERIQGASILVTKELPLSRTLIEQFPDSIELICEAGTGYNNIDLEAAEKKQIHVCNVPAYSSERVAHTVIMMICNASSSMKKQMRMLLEGDHRNFTDHLMVDHVEINGKTLGIIGAGNIGKEVMKTALAMGMNILVYTRTPQKDSEHIRYVDLNSLLKLSDYVSLHCPLNETTYHMINQKNLALMKPTAFLINTSRGALIDEEALLEALLNHQIAGAGLDVQEIEPLREDHPFYKMDEVILTPHMGWRGLETRQRLIDKLLDNIHQYERGNPINMVL